MPAVRAPTRPSSSSRSVVARQPGPDSNGAFDGLPILNGPISVGLGGAVEGDKGSKPVDRSKGLWTRCDKCGVILYIKHLKEHHHICFGCSYHLKMTSQERIDHLIDAGGWVWVGVLASKQCLLGPGWHHSAQQESATGSAAVTPLGREA